jgi:hypothetical protein
MRILLHFIFWSGLVGAIIRSGFLSLATYPRTDEIKLGEDVVRLIGGIALTAWAGVLLWR